MKPNFPHASESFRRLNPGLSLGSVATAKPQSHPGPALDQKPQAQESRGAGLCSGSPRYEITLVAATHRRLDGDNIAAGFKPLRDAIARLFKVDDNDDVVEWQYGQVRCSVEEGTIVMVRMKEQP